MSRIAQPDYTVMFGRDSNSVYSPIFRVFAGHVWVFKGFNFLQLKHRPDPKAEPSQTQQACLQQVIMREGRFPTVDQCEAPTVDYDQLKGSILITGLAQLDGCCWCLDACNSIAILDVPGEYYWELNDETAVGTVQIYGQWFTKDQFPYNSKLFFGR